MAFFFELLKNRVGFARIGRINLLGAREPIKTPINIIPLTKGLLQDLDFVDSFGDHELLFISDENHIDEHFLDGMFQDSGFLFTHYGTIERFNEIFNAKKDIFLKFKVCPIIPFNIPTTTLNFEFTKQEIIHHLAKIEDILTHNPDVNFGLSIKLFDYYHLFTLYIDFINSHSNIKILNFIDLFDNLNYYRNIIEVIISTKDQLNNNIVLMASGSIFSKHLPILVYLGVDIINTSYLTYLSTENYYDSIESLLPSYKIKYLPCNCLACKGKLKELLEEKYSEEKITLLCYHNLITAKIFMNKINQYLHTEDYRQFVEKSVLNDLNFISMLKILDRNYFEKIIQYTPLTQKNAIIECIGASSYYRPDIAYFRKQVIHTFTPEPWTSIIILLPCSAKKPYSQSRSHQLFYRAIRKFSEFPNFQEIILTSPLGAIPRQLEDIYPVSSYDISVTGYWDSEEVKLASEMLIELLTKYDKNLPIICHLDKGYRIIAESAQNELEHRFFYTNIADNLTSKTSLKNLTELIEEHLDEVQIQQNLDSQVIFTKTWNRKLFKIIEYQFGKDIGNLLFSEELSYRRNKQNTKLNVFNAKKEKLATFKFSTGRLYLTINGAEKIASYPQFSKYLIFDGTKIKGNTLFMPGIKEYPKGLLPADNVCIFDKNKSTIIAMGTMLVSSRFIQMSNSGRVAKLYETK
ncbi:MAG: Archaeosine synthase [Promethearchaeota archaeon]|nr:MAG: Archaeosine synthase [Candidatus Lokiarchaeota archaeon]